MEVPKYFEDLPDFRVKGRCLHELSDIVMLVLVGFIADCEDFEEVQDFGNDKKAYLQQVQVGALGTVPVPAFFHRSGRLTQRISAQEDHTEQERLLQLFLHHGLF
jgi:hypothetical protein